MRKIQITQFQSVLLFSKYTLYLRHTGDFDNAHDSIEQTAEIGLIFRPSRKQATLAILKEFNPSDVEST